MACQCTVDVVVGALCLHPQMAGTSLAPGEFPANGRLVEQLLYWLGQLAAVKDRTAERGNVLVVLTYADKFAMANGAGANANAKAQTAALEEKCCSVQAALRAQFPAWIPEWGQRRVVFAVSPTDDALIKPLVEQVRLLTAALVVDTPVPASYNRAVKLLRAMGAGCRLPLFAEDVVAAQLPESSAEDRVKALEHCVRVGEAVRVACKLKGGPDSPATPCLLLTPAAFLSRVLRCFISHRDDHGVPLGAKPLLDQHKAAPGVYTLSAIAQHVHSSVLLGEAAARAAAAPAESKAISPASAAAVQAEQLSVLGAAPDAERSAQLLIDALCALGFCRFVSLSQQQQEQSDQPAASSPASTSERLLVFPASTLPLSSADVGTRWHHELAALKQVSARPQSPQPWLGCAGLRWQSGNAARRARVTPSVITRVLDAIRLEARLQPEDIGGEFLLFRAEAGTVCIVLASGRSAKEGDWCDAYVCALGEQQDVAVANLRMALDAVSSVLLARLGDGGQQCELCPACLFHAGANAAAPLAARLQQQQQSAAGPAPPCERCRDRSLGSLFIVEHKVALACAPGRARVSLTARWDVSRRAPLQKRRHSASSCSSSAQPSRTHASPTWRCVPARARRHAADRRRPYARASARSPQAAIDGVAAGVRD
jgi:hypothetical protein